MPQAVVLQKPKIISIISIATKKPFIIETPRIINETFHIIKESRTKTIQAKGTDFIAEILNPIIRIKRTAKGKKAKISINIFTFFVLQIMLKRFIKIEKKHLKNVNS